MTDFDILLFFAEKHQQQKQPAVFLQAALYADHFRHFTKRAEHVGSWEVTMKKHVFFSTLYLF